MQPEENKPEENKNKKETGSLEMRVEELTEKVRQLEAAKPAERPLVTVGREGFSLRSQDGAFQLKLRGYFQSDGRFFVRDRTGSATTTLLLRRMRPVLEATVYKYIDFRLMPDFSGGGTTLFDAHFDLRLNPRFAVRIGKFKPPVGLERLQSAQDLLFAERGIPTNLVPSRDLGVQFYGELRSGLVSYAAGMFNGVPDLGIGDSDNNNGKDVAGRVFAQPFKAGKAKLLRELGVGISGARGRHQGTTTAPFLPGYRSPAQQVVFAYRTDGTKAGTVVVDGEHTRVSPQGYWYAGPVGLLAEYVRSSHLVRRGTTGGRLHHDAWQVAGAVVLTREASSCRGIVPKRPFDLSTHSWGAFEIGGRFGALTIDADAFPLFADPGLQVREVDSWGVAFNWYLARGVRVQLDYEQTGFDGGAAVGHRADERVAIMRVQHAF